MKTFIQAFILTFLTYAVSGQVISRFRWNNGLPTKASVGADALSVSSSATISTGGVGGSNGLNPGLPTNDVNLILAGAPFNVPGINISIDFRREESVVGFYTRGTSLDFGMNNGNLFVTFQVNNGGVAVTVNSGNIYAIPSDASFHHYSFNYDNITGHATVGVDGIRVYTYTGVPGRALYTTGAGNVTIGRDMDGTSKNITVLDNLLIQTSSLFTLPAKLLSFSAERKNNRSLISWSTTEEIQLVGFEVERSADGIHFESLKTVLAAGGYATTHEYHLTDSLPFQTATYYRLKTINIDSKIDYSTIRMISFLTTKVEMSCYPNPVTEMINLHIPKAEAGAYQYKISSIDGRTVAAGEVKLQNGAQTIHIDLTRTKIKGLLLVQLQTAGNLLATYKIVKN